MGVLDASRFSWDPRFARVTRQAEDGERVEQNLRRPGQAGSCQRSIGHEDGRDQSSQTRQRREWHKVDQVPNQEENVEETEEVAHIDQGTPIPSTPRNGPAPQQFDMSPRGTSPKRRAGDDDREDDSHDERPRPRSPTRR